MDEDCEKKSFFSLRLPVAVLRDALFQKDKPVWPPADLGRDAGSGRSVASLGDAPALFDSNAEGAVAHLFALQ